MDALQTTVPTQLSAVQDALTPSALLEQVQLIQNVMTSVMKENEHYGVIPGTGNKPSLLKAGAEKLCFTFRLRPQFEIEERELINSHREYKTICKLFSIANSNPVGEGLGICSTMESKFRYRTGAGEITEIDVPKSYWDTRKSDPKKAAEVLRELANNAGYEGNKFGTKKDENNCWKITTHGEKVEYDNPADYYNTVIKMSKKRAFVDAVITCTAASDIFTQDVEDLIDNGVIEPKHTPKPEPEKPHEKTKPAPKPRNYTSEFEACQTMDEVKKLWSSLNAAEKTQCVKLKDITKERIENQTANVEDAQFTEVQDGLMSMINNISTGAAESTLKAIDEAISKSNGNKANYLSAFNEKLNAIGATYEPQALPF